jgi:hypothetical protein
VAARDQRAPAPAGALRAVTVAANRGTIGNVADHVPTSSDPVAPSRFPADPWPQLQELAAEGLVQLPLGDWRDVPAPEGPPTRLASEALAEQRGDTFDLPG